MTDKPPPEKFAIELVVLPDPLARSRGSKFARTGEYRLRLALKDFLRGFGLRCTGAAPAPPIRCPHCRRDLRGGLHAPPPPERTATNDSHAAQPPRLR